ncbi:MAG: GIY-YIG nuclease family protein, partial [Planctomycetaceae bacterium]
MGYIVVLLLGLLGGGGCAYIALESKRREFAELKRSIGEKSDINRMNHELYTERKAKLDVDQAELHHQQAEFEARLVSYSDLANENALLKRDLRNFDVQMRKLRFDNATNQKNQAELDRKIQEISTRYLRENIAWIAGSITSNNFAASKQKLQDVIARCREGGFVVSPAEETSLHASLRAEYEKVVRAEFEREEQSRIKAQIREEQLREREVNREIKRLENEEKAIKAALERAVAEAQHQHSEEVERLKKRLVEAEERAKLASSQAAQLAKAGHVYVLSNIGSFGEGIFKVGMTRRLEPRERIQELGDASVPFPFDVHMMIASDNAPRLESALHRELFKLRLNRANPRKKFFRVDLETISEIVKEHHGTVQYVVDPEALEYRQSQNMSADDQQFVE